MYLGRRKLGGLERGVKSFSYRKAQPLPAPGSSCVDCRVELIWKEEEEEEEGEKEKGGGWGIGEGG